MPDGRPYREKFDPATGMYICHHCQTWKSREGFMERNDGTGRVYSKCRACLLKRHAEYCRRPDIVARRKSKTGAARLKERNAAAVKKYRFMKRLIEIHKKRLERKAV